MPCPSALSILLASATSAQATSTPEERSRWAEISHKLESHPLDHSVNKDGEWAFNRLGEVHDIHVPLCAALLGDKAVDVAAMNVASVGSVLKVVEPASTAMRENPHFRNTELESVRT
jgi:hypothetical protein